MMIGPAAGNQPGGRDRSACLQKRGSGHEFRAWQAKKSH